MRRARMPVVNPAVPRGEPSVAPHCIGRVDDAPRVEHTWPDGKPSKHEVLEDDRHLRAYEIHDAAIDNVGARRISLS